MQDFFDFANVEFQEAYVEESFVAEVQHEISRLMKAKGVTRAELARRMKVSAPHVTQMLGDEDANLTLRTVARIFDALGEKATIGVRLVAEEIETKSAQRQVAQVEWGSVVANDRWSHDDELGRAQESTGSVVVWMDAVRRAA